MKKIDHAAAAKVDLSQFLSNAGVTTMRIPINTRANSNVPHALAANRAGVFGYSKLSPKTIRFMRYTRMSMRNRPARRKRRVEKSGPPINTIKAADARMFRDICWSLRPFTEADEIARCLMHCGNPFKWRLAMRRRANEAMRMGNAL